MIRSAAPRSPRHRVLLTGATGYVGGRLLPLLESAGHQVRCLTRRPMDLASRVAPGTAVLAGDLLNPSEVGAAVEGVDSIYYLAHGMGGGDRFEEVEERAAVVVARAARAARVRRIIYLGGLGQGSDLSPHLASRQRVGEILRGSGVPTIEFRASIIIGSGSLSFEIIRGLVERLPVMVAPRWVRRLAQPIGIEDVLAYLVEALDVPAGTEGVVEIGGADRVSYGWLLQEYARQRKLRRWIVPVPVLSPRLSSLWLGLVTPVYARIGRKLVDSLRHDTVVTDHRAPSLFTVRPRGAVEAIARALANEDREVAATRWSDAASSVAERTPGQDTSLGRRLVDSRATWVPAAPDAAFRPIERIGGRIGWYWGNWLWRLRGLMDLAVGGAGVRRGRRDPERLAPGDTVDWWRVEAVERGRLLRLRAEMRLPGRAWLQFEVEPDGQGGSTIRQTAIFDPRGLLGRVYWYALAPIHFFVFGGMLTGIARAVAAPPRAGIGVTSIPRADEV